MQVSGGHLLAASLDGGDTIIFQIPPADSTLLPAHSRFPSPRTTSVEICRISALALTPAEVLLYNHNGEKAWLICNQC